MSALQIDTKVNIVAALTLMVGLAYTYSDVKSRMAEQAEQIRSQNAVTASIAATLRDRMTISDASDAAKDTRIRALEIDAAGKDSDLRNIQIGINEIKVSISQLSQKVGK